jgi:hypothetical protein
VAAESLLDAASLAQINISVVRTARPYSFSKVSARRVTGSILRFSSAPRSFRVFLSSMSADDENPVARGRPPATAADNVYRMISRPVLPL